MTFEGKCFISGVLRRIREITVFLNSTTNSYKRFGKGYAPRYVNWSFENRGQLIRIPRTPGAAPRIELRSADACCNPYVAFKLILAAGIEGIRSADCSLMDSTMKSRGSDLSGFEPLPSSLSEAAELARSSSFVRRTLPQEVISSFFARIDQELADYESADSKESFEEETYFKFV